MSLRIHLVPRLGLTSNVKIIRAGLKVEVFTCCGDMTVRGKIIIVLSGLNIQTKPSLAHLANSWKKSAGPLFIYGR